MTKIIYTRKNVWLDTKLARIKREVRTQPIMAAMILTVASFGIYQCSSLPEADAVTLPTAQAASLSFNEMVEETPGIQHPGDELTKVDFSYFGKSNKVGPLMGAYLGFVATQDRPAALPQSTTINWADNLKSMWAKKVAKKSATPSTIKNADEIVNFYAKSERDTKTLREFITQVDMVARQTHASINYTTLCEDLDIDHDKCPSFKYIMSRINGKSIVAYGMTEIFPAQNGEYNIVALDTILRNAGENYLDSIPALGDGLLSKGFYQLTSYAVRRDGSGFIGGANYVDNHAGMKLPGSVLYIRHNNSHKAAFEFAVYNIGIAVRRMNNRQIESLTTKCSVSELTQGVAVAHHQPRGAIRAIVNWTNDECSKPYKTYLSGSLKTYAIKTEKNYNALKSFM